MDSATRARSELDAAGWEKTPDRVRSALLASTVLNLFEVLDVAITLWEPGRWREIHERTRDEGVLDLELEHTAEVERNRHNIRSLAKAGRTKKSVLAEQSGFTDLFVPVCSSSGPHAILVTGPFLRSRPSSTEILEGWRKFSGQHGDPRDPAFARYVTTTLGTLVLEGTRVQDFKLLVEKLARLFAQQGSPVKLMSEIETLSKRLVEARIAERTWFVAHALLDPKTARAWASRYRRPRLHQLGIRGFPERVAVGLLVNRAASSDPVDELLRRDAFQRATVELAQKSGDIAGKLGEHGVTLLTLGRGSADRTRRHLLDLAEAATALARKRYGFDLHVGVSKRAEGLSEQYLIALNAAEAALSRTLRLVELDSETPLLNSLGSLRRKLAELTEENPAALAAEFDRYAEATVARSYERLDLAQSHLEAGLDAIVSAVQKSELLNVRSVNALLRRVERSARSAASVRELCAAYRSAVSDLGETSLRPTSARRDTNLRRAQEYVERHFREGLSLARVAKVAGFAPRYFSKLFHEKVGITFEQFLSQLRTQRACELLTSSALSVERVAQLSGFSTPEYLSRAFKRTTGQTPTEFRRASRKESGVSADPLYADD